MTIALRQTDQIIDDDGNPVVNGFYYVGAYQQNPKTTALSLFSDPGFTTAIANPQRTDSYGRPQNDIYIKQDRYSYLVSDEDDVTIEGPKDRLAQTADFIPTVATLAELPAALLNVAVGKRVDVLGRTSTGDGYQGSFFRSSTDYSAEVAVDTQQAIYIDLGDGTYGVRSFGQAVSSKPEIKDIWFGLALDGATDDAPKLQTAFDLAPNSGIIALSTDAATAWATEISITKPVTVRMNSAVINMSAVNGVKMNASGIVFDGDFAQITHTGTGLAFYTDPASAVNYTNIELRKFTLLGSASGTGGIRLRNVHYGLIDGNVRNYTAGSGVIIEGHPTGHANDYAMRCTVSTQSRIENNKDGVVLGGVGYGPANANEVKARINGNGIASSRGVVWNTGRPNTVSDANIEFCAIGVDGSAVTGAGILTIISSNFENNTTDVINENDPDVRIGVINSDIFSFSDPGQYMLWLNNGVTSGGNISYRKVQFGEGYKFDGVGFATPPTHTMNGDVTVGLLGGAGGRHMVGTTDPTLGIAGAAPISAKQAYNSSQHCEARAVSGSGFSVDLVWNQAAAGDNNFVEFATEATYTPRGSITYNRGSGLVAYNTTSDYRAKKVNGECDNSGEIIDQLTVYNGTMNGADVERPMLIAHEAQAIMPYAVTGEKDAVDDEGKPIYQQMDHSSIVPLLLAEIKSLRARLDALEGGA